MGCEKCGKKRRLVIKLRCEAKKKKKGGIQPQGDSPSIEAVF